MFVMVCKKYFTCWLWFTLLCVSSAESEDVPPSEANVFLTEEVLQAPQVERRRPGAEGSQGSEHLQEEQEYPAATTQDQGQIQKEKYRQDPLNQPVTPSVSEFLSAPDRWTMFDQGKWYDPYNQNILKGDLKFFGTDAKPWFLNLGAMSDTLFERRHLPTTVGNQSNKHPESTDVFGNFGQRFVSQNVRLELSLIKGNTVFRPPDFELRLIPQVNVNSLDVDEVRVVRADPARGTRRTDAHITLLEAFVDCHLVNLSDRYDFVSSRIGIQKFNSDFRGFIYNDEQPGIRFFGNLDNNRYQWNLAWFHRLEKDVNSGLTKLFDPRSEEVYVANLYRQDLIAPGHDVNFSLLSREDTFGRHGKNFDENGFLTTPAPFGDERPKSISSTYLGVNSNGHIDRFNITSALYYVFGRESHSQLAERAVDISAGMAAAELSYDIDWLRPRVSFFWASGDGNPHDSHAHGFDAIFDNPVFAGSENSYYIGQGIPLIGGGGVALTNRLSLLANLRAGKEQGQSNFVNPGIFLYNVGLDVDVAPKVILSNNINWIEFDEVASIALLRQDGSIDRSVGLDLNSGVQYRPFLNNNVQLKLGAAALFPGQGFKNLYGDRTLYQVFTRAIFVY